MKNILYWSVSIISLLVIAIITFLLYEKGASGIIIGIYVGINSSMSKMLCDREQKMKYEVKRGLYIIIAIVIAVLLCSIILYSVHLVESIKVLYDISLGFYFLLLAFYLKALINIE